MTINQLGAYGIVISLIAVLVVAGWAFARRGR
jgi:hypothetical protein